MASQDVLNIPAIVAILLTIFAGYKFLFFPVFISLLSKIPAAHWSSHVSPLWVYYIRWKLIENQTWRDEMAASGSEGETKYKRYRENGGQGQTSHYRMGMERRNDRRKQRDKNESKTSLQPRKDRQSYIFQSSKSSHSYQPLGLCRNMKGACQLLIRIQERNGLC